MANIFDLFRKIEQPAPPAVPITHLVVGLGDPGAEYAFTRHNTGFLALDAIAGSLGVRIDRAKFRAFVGEAVIAEKRVLLVKPQTFMNLSGESVAPVVKYHNATPADLLVVQDDIDLAVGRLRIRTGGSCGGHNGVRNIIERLGTPNFTRLKIGVGKHRSNVIAHVLGKFDPETRAVMDRAVAAAAEAAIAIVRDGPARAMNLYNGFDATHPPQA